MRLLLASSLIVLSLTACSGNEMKDKPTAEVTEPAPTPPVEEPKAEVTGTAYQADLAASKIEWVGAKVTKEHPGAFGKFEGSALINEGKVVGADFSVETASLTSDDPKLTEHLQSPDFFDVAQFPKASFTSRNIVEKPTPEGATHEVTGELELHGVKKTITFPATIAVAADKATTKAEFKINRKDFGIVYPGKPDDLIKDDVLIKLDLAFPLAAAPAADPAAPAGAPANDKPDLNIKPGVVAPGGKMPPNLQGGPGGPGPGPGGKGPGMEKKEEGAKATQGGERR
ncbi:YceI family protein [Myxococcota bacterium]|nr:YceI family protein [Myxococcota bacterium]